MADYTKLDRLRENTAAANVRRENIAKLSANLSEAREIYTMLPRGTMQAETDRRELNEHINLLSELIADEKRALSELIGGEKSGVNADEVAAKGIELMYDIIHP